MLGLAVLALIGAAGCGARSQLRITSYIDPPFPENYSFEPTECAQWIDAGGDLHIVATATRLGSGSAAKAITQILHIQMYWKPYPGKTPANRTATDATLRYVVFTPEGAAAYTGTGFVYATQPRFGPLKVDLERAELRPAEHTADFTDILGEMHVAGRLRPAKNQNRAIAMIRQADVAVASSASAQ